MSPQLIRLLICAAVLEGACLLPHLADNRATQIQYVLLGYAVGGAAFAVVLYLLRTPVGQIATRRSWLWIVAAGLAFRLTLLPLMPATSPDVHRYLWEGVVQRAGYSPYMHPPADAALADVAARWPELYRNANQPSMHPEIPAIYPPVAQLLFAANAWAFGGALWGWKLILLVFDALLMLGAWAVLQERSLHPVHLVAVAWCPLLLFEFYEAAHLDLVGVALLVWAYVAARRQQPLRCGVLLALACSVKYLWPVVGGVILLRVLLTPGARWRCLVAFGGMCGLVWLPYLSSIPAAAGTVLMFVGDWRFNDVVLELLRDALPGPGWIPMAVVLASLAVLLVALLRRWHQRAWADMWLVSGWTLLLGPVAYPWYFLWIVPALLVTAPVWAVLWVLFVPALHVVHWQEALTGQWHETRWLWWVVTVPPAALLVRATWQRLRPAADEAAS